MDEVKLTRTQFATAASAAVRAVLDLYGETEAILRVLDGAMHADGFQDWYAKPGGKKVVTNRILREWQGRLYVRGTGDESDEEEDDAEDEEAPDDDEGGQTEHRRRSGPREILPGSAVAFVRARFYRPREVTFEPEILCGVLINARIPLVGLPPEKPLRLKKSAVQRILAQVDVNTPAGRELRTNAPVIVPKQKGLKTADRSLRFDVPEAFKSIPLYEIDSLERGRSIAEDLLKTYERLVPR